MPLQAVLGNQTLTNLKLETLGETTSFDQSLAIFEILMTENNFFSFLKVLYCSVA